MEIKYLLTAGLISYRLAFQDSYPGPTLECRLIVNNLEMINVASRRAYPLHDVET